MVQKAAPGEGLCGVGAFSLRLTRQGNLPVAFSWIQCRQNTSSTKLVQELINPGCHGQKPKATRSVGDLNNSTRVHGHQANETCWLLVSWTSSWGRQWYWGHWLLGLTCTSSRSWCRTGMETPGKSESWTGGWAGSRAEAWGETVCWDITPHSERAGEKQSLVPTAFKQVPIKWTVLMITDPEQGVFELSESE